MIQEEKSRRYDEILEKANALYKTAEPMSGCNVILETLFPELKESEDEQDILFEELKALHLRMEHQTVCNDAGGNRMWRRAWQHINEAINIIKEDKETYKW